MNIPKTMTGVWLTGHGGLDKLVYKTDIPVPMPGPGDVLVRVTAAGVNNTDINTRVGWYSKSDADDDASWAGAPLTFPRIQGADICGVITDTGVGVPERRIGERVLVEPCLQYFHGKYLEQPYYLGSECDGGFAQFTIVPGCHAYKIDTRLSDTELASFPCSYSTAENMLTRAQVKKGDTILVTGASGGVGSAAVQLAKYRGANVAAVTSRSKADALMSVGADRIVFRDDSLVDKLGKNSMDAVIDLVAGDMWPQFPEILRPKGRYAVSGAIAGPIVSLDVRTLYLKDLTFLGCTRLEPSVFANLVKAIGSKKIKPLVAAEYDLSDIGSAQERFLQKNFIGKIVLKVP